MTNWSSLRSAADCAGSDVLVGAVGHSSSSSSPAHTHTHTCCLTWSLCLIKCLSLFRFFSSAAPVAFPSEPSSRRLIDCVYFFFFLHHLHQFFFYFSIILSFLVYYHGHHRTDAFQWWCTLCKLGGGDREQFIEANNDRLILLGLEHLLVGGHQQREQSHLTRASNLVERG